MAEMLLVTHSYEIRILQFAGFTACSFLQAQALWLFSPKTTPDHIDVIAYCEVPLGLLGNQKFQAFVEGRCKP